MSDDACEIPARPGSDEAGDEARQRLRYRLLTGAGDRAFCERISAALDDGYVLYGDPVLTSLDDQALRELGITEGAAAHAGRLARLAHDCGLDGVVCSAWEARAIKAANERGRELGEEMDKD